MRFADRHHVCGGRVHLVRFTSCCDVTIWFIALYRYYGSWINSSVPRIAPYLLSTFTWKPTVRWRNPWQVRPCTPQALRGTEKDHAAENPAVPNIAFRRYSAGVRERTGGGQCRHLEVRRGRAHPGSGVVDGRVRSPGAERNTRAEGRRLGPNIKPGTSRGWPSAGEAGRTPNMVGNPIGETGSTN